MQKGSTQEITSNMRFDALNKLDTMERIKSLEDELKLEKDYHRVRIINFQMLGIEYM